MRLVLDSQAESSTVNPDVELNTINGSQLEEEFNSPQEDELIVTMAATTNNTDPMLTED